MLMCLFLFFFQSLPLWIEECNKHMMIDNVPRILVGNKCDCKGDFAVPTNVAQRFADHHCMPVRKTFTLLLNLFVSYYFIIHLT